MKTSTYNSWWREMGAISRGMMFIEGNIATPASLDRAQQDPRPAGAPRSSSPQGSRQTGQGKKNFSLYEDLLFLGGRPMTAGHNDDIEEPFPQTRAGTAGVLGVSSRLGDRRRGRVSQPQHCATC